MCALWPFSQCILGGWGCVNRYRRRSIWRMGAILWGFLVRVLMNCQINFGGSALPMTFSSGNVVRTFFFKPLFLAPKRAGRPFSELCFRQMLVGHWVPYLGHVFCDFGDRIPIGLGTATLSITPGRDLGWVDKRRCHGNPTPIWRWTQIDPNRGDLYGHGGMRH